MGILLSSNFTLNAQLPLDSRTVVVDSTARIAIPSIQRFDGLKVYQVSDNTEWQLQGGITDPDWALVTSAGGSSLIGQTSGIISAPAAPGPGTETFLGEGAGSSTNTTNTVAIGYFAGNNASSAGNGIFIGSGAGNGATSASNSEFIGVGAGFNATGANNSAFIGNSAGSGATNALRSNFFGPSAGQDATDANNSFFVGFEAGLTATNAENSIFIGAAAGSGATNAANSIFIGTVAGSTDTVDNTGGGTSIAIGQNAGTGGFSNSIAIGRNAVNTMSDQFAIGSSYINWQIAGIDYVMPPGQGSVGYVLTDVAGNGTLTWEPGASLQDLQSVTDVGNTTTNDISLISGSDTLVLLGNDGGDGVIAVNLSGGGQGTLIAGASFSTGSATISQTLDLRDSVNSWDGIFNTQGLLSAVRQWDMPDADGTLALSVNGNTADTEGNITISGVGSVTSITQGTGITLSPSTITTTGSVTANLSTGIAGSQSVIGGTASGETLTLSSTANATKGKILFGTSAYDEVNNRLGIGTASPAAALSVVATGSGAVPVIYGSVDPGSGIGNAAQFEMRNTNATNNKVQFNIGGGSPGGTYGRTWSIGTDQGGAGVVDFYLYSGAANAIRFYIDTAGNIGVKGNVTPTAVLHLPAVGVGASTAPLKLTLGGTLMTAPEAGAIEAINGHIYWTDSTATRFQLDQQSGSGGTVTSISQGTGITLSTNPIVATGSVTSNLSTGVSGGQSVIGGTASGNSLTLSSTSNATKGSIIFGTSSYDEANNTLGVGAVGGSTNKMTIADTVLAGSGSLAGSALSITQTWNTSGAPIALKLNVTNTASGAGLLMDLQVGGTSQFKVSKAGALTVIGAIATNAGISTGGLINVQSSAGIRSPALEGGNTASSTLTFYSTSGAGTSDAIIFNTGSAVEAARFLTGGNFQVAKSIIMNGAASVLRLKGYTVATLPAGTAGDTAYVTDATLPVYGAALTGGGAVVVPVFYTGAAWISC